MPYDRCAGLRYTCPVDAKGTGSGSPDSAGLGRGGAAASASRDPTRAASSASPYAPRTRSVKVCACAAAARRLADLRAGGYRARTRARSRVPAAMGECGGLAARAFPPACTLKEGLRRPPGPGPLAQPMGPTPLRAPGRSRARPPGWGPQPQEPQRAALPHRVVLRPRGSRLPHQPPSFAGLRGAPSGCRSGPFLRRRLCVHRTRPCWGGASRSARTGGRAGLGFACARGRAALGRRKAPALPRVWDSGPPEPVPCRRRKGPRRSHPTPAPLIPDWGNGRPEGGKSSHCRAVLIQRHHVASRCEKLNCTRLSGGGQAGGVVLR